MILKNPSTHTLIEKLSKTEVNLILVAEKSSIDFDELISTANENAYRIAGAIFPMVIHENEAYEDAVILNHVDSPYEPFLVENIGKNDLKDSLPEKLNEVNSCMVFLDGLSADVPLFLDALYEKYWNEISFMGGGAGSFTLQQMPCVFTKKGVFQDAAILLMCRKVLSLGIKHGWEKVAGPFVANKTEGNKILELNWRPAFDVYREVVEEYSEYTFDNTDFFNVSKGFPFGVYREGQEDVVRDPIAVDKDGVLTCVGHVNQNTSLNILKGEKENLIACAQMATINSLTNGQNGIFVVDCISRILYLEDDFKEELEAVKKVIRDKGDDLVLEGVLSIGEISSNGEGSLELYNKTIVVSSYY